MKLTFLSSKLTFLSLVSHPFNTGCLPLSYSSNPGVNAVSHREGCGLQVESGSEAGDVRKAIPRNGRHGLR